MTPPANAPSIAAPETNSAPDFSQGSPQAKQPPPSKLYSIQYLRAAAAMMVVIYHAVYQPGGPPVTESLQAGVDIFFVISGFIVAFVTARKRYTPWLFLRMRIVRIVPVYWFYTILAASLLFLTPGLFHGNELSWRHLLLSLIIVPHAVGAHSGQFKPIVKQGWTLEYEMFFYLLFAFAMAATHRFRIWISGLLLILLPMVGYLAASHGGSHAQSGGETALSLLDRPIILEFGMGMLLCAAYLHGALILVNRAVSLLLIALGFAAIFLSGINAVETRTLWFGIPALAIVAGAVSLEAHGWVGSFKPLLLLGDASYSIYLVHAFPIAVMKWFWLREHFGTGNSFSSWVFVISCLAVSVPAGIGSYLWIEKPSLKFLRRTIESPQC